MIIAWFKHLGVALASLLFSAAALAQLALSAPNLLLQAAGSVSAIARQADGKIIVGGSFNYVNGVLRNNIARLNADGSLDASWNPDADRAVSALAIDGDGNVYVGGSFSTIGGLTRYALAKLDGASGAAAGSWNPFVGGQVHALALDNASLFAGGMFISSDSQDNTISNLIKVDVASGQVSPWNPQVDGSVYALALDGTTNLVVGGDFSHMGPTARKHLAKVSVTTASAMAWSPDPDGNSVRALAWDGSGNLFVGGDFTHINGQARDYLAQADSAGVITAWNAQADASVAALLPDGLGNLYVGGFFTHIGGQARKHLAKLDASASALPWAADADGGVEALALDGSSNLYVGGMFQTMSGLARLGVARLDSSGSAGGLVVHAGTTGAVNAMARQADGKVVVGGYFSMAGNTTRNNVLRLNADGTLDTGWDPNADGMVLALTVDSSAHVYAGGYFSSIGGQARSYLAQLNTTSGAATTWVANADDVVTALAADAAGHVYAGGQFCDVGGQSRCYVAQLDAITGAATSWDALANGPVNAFVFDAAGKLFVGGEFTQIGGQPRNYIAQLSVASPLASSWVADADASVYALTFDTAGLLTVGGRFSSIGGQTRNNIAKLSPSTAAVTGWNANANGAVYALAAESSGTVYAGGFFSQIGTQTRHFVAQLYSSNASATAWNPDADAGVLALAPGNAGEVYVGGNFGNVGGLTRTELAALAPGALDSAPPDAPSGVSAMVAGAGQVSVSFTAPAANGSAISGYTVMASPGGATHGGTASPIVIDGLSAGITYTFSVTATNAAGTGAASADSAGVVATGAPQPPVIGAVARGNAHVSVSFTPPGNTGGLTIGKYTVTASPGGFWAEGAGSPIDVTGLSNGTSYTFRVTATNSAGNSVPSLPSASATPATLAAAPLIGLASAGNGQATVRFGPPASNGGSAIISYTVTSSPDGHSGTGAASPVVVSGLSNSVQYTFTVTATNDVGTGAVSEASNSVTPSSSVVNLTSRFFVGNLNAEQVMAGVPYDMNDPAWLLGSTINRGIFAYKVFAALFMIGYQTGMDMNHYRNDQHVLAIKAFQSNNGQTLSNLLNIATLALLDQQVAQREAVLAPIAAGFSLYTHLLAQSPNEVSPDTIASIFALPMNALPTYLQLPAQELADCTAGQCVGFIRDASNTQDLMSPINLSSDYVFVGHYFDPKLPMSRLPSGPVLISTVLHEYGHYLNGSAKMVANPHMGLIDTTDFFAISYDLSSRSSSGCFDLKVNNPQNWLSRYGYKSTCGTNQYGADEDWAESFSLYVTAGRDFRAAAVLNTVIAQKYEWLRANVFFGEEYDTDLPADTFQGCADVYFSDPTWKVPGYLHCNDNYRFNFTLPKLPPTRVDGACGASSGNTFATAPGTRLCASGKASILADNGGAWGWSCQGFIGGGSATNCTAAKGTQTVNFGIAPSVFVGGTGTLNASGGLSGNPVDFTSFTLNVCTVSGNVVTGVGVGNCTLWANQAGDIHYAPTNAGPFTFSVTAPPGIAFNPNPLTFATQDVGTSVAQNITLTNTGGAALEIANIAATPAVFGVTSTCAASLPVGANCSLSVTFTPNAVGGRLGAVTVSSNAPGSPHSVSVSATGYVAKAPVCAVSANPKLIAAGASATLSVSCNPSADSFVWSGGTCVGNTTANCTVAPATTTTYSVTGSNSFGLSTASTLVRVGRVDLAPILLLLMD